MRHSTYLVMLVGAVLGCAPPPPAREPDSPGRAGPLETPLRTRAVIDLLWHLPQGADFFVHTSGLYAGYNVTQVTGLGTPQATGDFDLDGYDDVVYRTPEGGIVVWLLQSSTSAPGSVDARPCGEENVETCYVRLPDLDSAWSAEAVADLDRDGVSDIVWQNGTTGGIRAWLLERAGQGLALRESIDASWAVTPGTLTLVDAYDYNSDGDIDLLFQNRAPGAVEPLTLWFADGPLSFASTTNLGAPTAADEWTLDAVADFDSNGTRDFLWNGGRRGTLRYSLRGSGDSINDVVVREMSLGLFFSGATLVGGLRRYGLEVPAGSNPPAGVTDWLVTTQPVAGEATSAPRPESISVLAFGANGLIESASVGGLSSAMTRTPDRAYTATSEDIVRLQWGTAATQLDDAPREDPVRTVGAWLRMTDPVAAPHARDGSLLSVERTRDLLTAVQRDLPPFALMTPRGPDDREWRSCDPEWFGLLVANLRYAEVLHACVARAPSFYRGSTRIEDSRTLLTSCDADALDAAICAARDAFITHSCCMGRTLPPEGYWSCDCSPTPPQCACESGEIVQHRRVPEIPEIFEHICVTAP